MRRGEAKLFWVDVFWRDASWYCSDCFNRWPENPPPQCLPRHPKKYIAETAAEFASLTADAALPPEPDEPVVENYWQRADGRMIFLVRCPWGRVRIEKRVHLVSLGGTPLYEQIGGEWPPIGADYTLKATAKRHWPLCGSNGGHPVGAVAVEF